LSLKRLLKNDFDVAISLGPGVLMALLPDVQPCNMPINKVVETRPKILIIMVKFACKMG